MDDGIPALTRCFRGHATPVGKTFCESCGASLEPTPSPRPASPATSDSDVVPEVSRRRLFRR